MERSEKEFKRLLKDGLKTEKNYLYTAMDGDVDAGMLWIAIIKNDGEHDIIWIYDIMVNQDMRGKGYGFQIMNALEEKAKELGQSTILLHVFGHNTPAIELYKKCGYVISNMVMQKNIEIK
jgi:GNAT superfamily N-acetyltransferase